jgi:hypothetical protein
MWKPGAVALALMLVAGAAHATSWYELNSSEARCITAAEAARGGIIMFASPGAYQTWLRTESRFNGMRIVRDSDRNVSSVMVNDTDNMVISFFQKLETCEDCLRLYIQKGILASPYDLR